MDDVFLSHASQDDSLVSRLAASLTNAGLNVWIDDTRLRFGDPLVQRIQDAIVQSRNFALCWSRSALDSSYVNDEWLAAYHLKKPIIPCLLDSTPLPPFLLRYVYCDFRTSFLAGCDGLVKALVEQSDRADPTVIAAISREEKSALESLLTMDLVTAAKKHQATDTLISSAIRQWPKDPTVLNLAGYHKKTAYVIKHFSAIQAGTTPRDRLLDEAKRLFYAALSLQPEGRDNPELPSTLAGLGNVLMFEGALDGAEFFLQSAMKDVNDRNLFDHGTAQSLSLVRHMKTMRQ
jgi:hypothetical protein